MKGPSAISMVQSGARISPFQPGTNWEIFSRVSNWSCGCCQRENEREKGWEMSWKKKKEAAKPLIESSLSSSVGREKKTLVFSWKEKRRKRLERRRKVLPLIFLSFSFPMHERSILICYSYSNGWSRCVAMLGHSDFVPQSPWIFVFYLSFFLTACKTNRNKRTFSCHEIGPLCFLVFICRQQKLCCCVRDQILRQI